MSRVRVKICGITSERDLFTAVEAGADAVGFIVDVPQSPRNLPINKAKALMKATPIFVKTVAVTVPKSLNHLEEIYMKLNPDAVQVHGITNMHEEAHERLPDACLIGAIQVGSDLNVDYILKATSVLDAVLLDTYVPNRYGGTGRIHDWRVSRRVRDAVYPKPLILAGGLRPENVGEAIRAVKPYAVDVSSGVELRPGVKDRDKVFEFVRNAKEVEI